MRKLAVAVCVMAIVALCACPASALPINVARQGTASESNPAYGGVASRAIDGGLGRSYGADATTTHTNANPFNWWEVDLGGTYDISQIDLHNRGDCCTPNRLGDFRVSVLDAPGGSVVYSEHFPGDVGIGNVASFTPPAGTMGQVVQVQIVGENGGANDGRNNAGTGTLSLREVVVLADADVPNGVNLAANYGVAEQISTLNNSYRPAAHKAIDGNTNGVFTGGSVSHTNGNRTAWWQVDLTATANLDHITIFERTDGCCNGRLNNFTVSVLDETMATVYSQSVADVPGRLDLALPYGTEGRHVRVQFNDNGSSRTLELAEVQVAGGGLPNLARNPAAVASQSTTSAGGVPSRAIDGNTNGSWGAGSVSHTNPTTPNNWWQVDLGDDFSLDEVVLYNRADCCGGRLSNFRLSVLDGGDEVFGQDLFKGSGSVPQGDYLRVPLPEGTIGDRVRVQLLGQNNDGNTVVSLAEAQVWGNPDPTTAPLATFSAEGATNVAPLLGAGSASQSSDYSSAYPASKAIDRDLGNFSHTAAGDTPATWEVNLQTSVALEKLVLHNRDSCCQGRLRDITVQIFDPTGTTEVFNSGLINPENAMGSPAEIEIDLRALTGAPVSGGLVRVTRTPDPDFSGGGSSPDDRDILSLGEVQAFTDRRYKNVALGGAATQSSTHGAGPAANATDGNLGNFTHTLNWDTNATLEVDLGATFQLESLMLHNRDSCCGGRLRDVTVEVLGSDGSVAFTSPLLNPENALGSPDFIPVDLKGLTGGAVEGRFLRVHRTPDDDFSGGGSSLDDARVLSLGELQAYSSFAITGDTAPGGISKQGLLYHLDAGKGVVTTSSGAATWIDQSGNGNDFVQAAVAKQPDLVPNAINGQPVIRFDGDNSSNANADELVLGTSTTPRTVIIVNNTFQYRGLDGIWGIENADTGLRMYPSGQWRYPGNVGDFASSAGSLMFINDTPGNAAGLNTPHILTAIRGSSPVAFSRTSLGQYFIDGHGAGVRAWNGDIGEVIAFDRVLNQAELAMVANHLSAKYDLPLTWADLYRGDEPAQGNYDRDVFGIGQVDAANKVTAAGSAGLGLMVENGSLGDGDFLLAGHARPINSIVDTQLSGFAIDRWDRAWFLDKTGDLDALLTFDFGDAGLPFLGLPLDDAYQFALLYADELGDDFEVLDWNHWTLNGDQVSFAIPDAMLRDGYYTLGTAYVPEPATLSLLALGALGLLRRRKRW